jgi:hypothetical protein
VRVAFPARRQNAACKVTQLKQNMRFAASYQLLFASTDSSVRMSDIVTGSTDFYQTRLCSNSEKKKSLIYNYLIHVHYE